LNFFLWSYANDQVFRPKVFSVVELSARINSSVASVTTQMLEIEYRLDILLATNGANVEKY
jgi:hypothetical protein